MRKSLDKHILKVNISFFQQTNALESLEVQSGKAEQLIKSLRKHTLEIQQYSLTLCLSYLNPYCMGRKTAFFHRAFKFTYYTRNRSHLQEKKIITIKLKNTE
jgi:hypothetical protein